MKLLTKVKLSLAFLMLFISSSVFADACLEGKVNDFRALEGEEVIIRYDMLEMWRQECSGSPVAVNTPSVPSIKLQRQGSWIFIQSEENVLSVDSVIVNRGNCTVNPMFDKPFTIKFGQIHKVLLFDGCDVIEVNMHIGGYLYSWSFN